MYTHVSDRQGGILTFFLIGLGLSIFFIIMLIVFSYMAGYIRVDIGPETQHEDIIYDKNTITELDQREKILQQRERHLAQQEKQLKKILAQIDIEERKITEDHEAVKSNLDEISAYFERFSVEEEANFKRLAQMYQTMKPARVATIFKELNMETVAELLKRMKSRSSAKILGEIGSDDAHRAAQISDIIKGEKKSDAFIKAVK
ncbi:MAG: hypothetical protein KKH94_13340 [Candidatus Omnitrophica bacterium]|nr:hypothetical protein [Candidatus Omnitrophota bacterium]